MLTDAERAQLARRRIAAESAKPAEASLMLKMAEWPDYPPPIDHNDSLGKIGEALGKISGADIAKAISALGGTAKAVAGLQEMLADIAEAVAKIKPAGVDLSAVVKALDANTAAQRDVAKALLTPKDLVFDEDDEQLAVGWQPRRGN